MTNEEKKRIIKIAEEMKNSLTELQRILTEDVKSSALAETTEVEKIVVAEEKAENQNVTPKKVKELLKEFGIFANFKGYEYIVYSIVYLAENQHSTKYLGITKSLYPAIAIKFNITTTAVERSIRYVVQYICNVKNQQMIDEVFGPVMKLRKRRLKNAEFLFGCLQYLEDK